MRRTMIGRFAGAIAVAWLLIPGHAAASELLGEMECAFLVVEDPSDAAVELDLTPDFLYASLKVGVTENMPRLSVDPDECANDIYLNVSVVHTRATGGRSLDYTALVRLEVRRLGRVLENRSQGMVTVWDASSLLAGEPDESKTLIMETIRELAADLGSAWRATGNS